MHNEVLILNRKPHQSYQLQLHTWELQTPHSEYFLMSTFRSGTHTFLNLGKLLSSVRSKVRNSFRSSSEKTQLVYVCANSSLLSLSTKVIYCSYLVVNVLLEYVIPFWEMLVRLGTLTLLLFGRHRKRNSCKSKNKIRQENSRFGRSGLVFGCR